MSKIFSSKKKDVQKTEIDPQIYNRVLQNLQFAEDVAAIPYEPYRGMMVAPFTRDYMAGEAMTRRIAQEGGFVPEVEQAARAAQRELGFQPERISAGAVGTQFGARDIGGSLARGPERISAGRVGSQFAAPSISAPGSIRSGYTPGAITADRISAGTVGTQFAPERVAAGQIGTTFSARDIGGPGAAPTAQAAGFLDQDLGRYMNPYEAAVTQAGLEDISRAEEQARGTRSARATAARAFGGSRAAIEEGIAAGEAARERNRFVAEQRARGFREAAALREADVGREQAVRLSNQQAAQNVLELAQRGQISNQQRDMELARLGVTAGQANVDAQMRAALANQQAMQEAQRLGLTAQQANVQAQIEAARANQSAGLQAQQAAEAARQEAARMGLSADETNQRVQLAVSQANQQAAQQAQQLGLTAEQFNVEQGMRAGAANQQAMQDYMRMGLSAEEANQRAQLDAQRLGTGAEQFNVNAAMEAARANQAAGVQGAELRLGAGRDLAGYGQTALENRYGAGRAMMGLGTQQQQLYQQFLNAQREEDLRRQQFPLQQLAIRQGAVQASPMNVTQTGITTGRPSYFEMAGRVASAFAPTPTGSDERMKRDIKKIRNPLDRVNRLKGIEFEWEDGYGEREGEDMGGEEDMGMSAQSVERAMPEAVSRRESDGMRQYDLPQVVGLLTEAVKELDKKVGAKRRRSV